MARKVDAFHAALSSIAADENAMALMNLSSDSYAKRLEILSLISRFALLFL